MDNRINITNLNDPNQLAKLISHLSIMSDELDYLYTETAPNGTISARQGRIALYNNSGTYTTWINTDGSTTWKQIDAETSLTGYMSYSDTRFVAIKGTRDMTAASGDVEYSGVGFTPKAIICLSAVDGTPAASVGFSDGATDRGWATNASGTADNFDVIGAVIRITTASGKFQTAKVKSFASDKVTLTWAKESTPTGTAKVYILCLR